MRRVWLVSLLLVLLVGATQADPFAPVTDPDRRNGPNPGDDVDPADPPDLPPGSSLVSTSLTPLSDHVPGVGGVLSCMYALSSQMEETVNGVSLWTMVTLPNGDAIGPLTQVDFTLLPLMKVPNAPLNQVVPGYAPEGEYTYSVHLGFYPTAFLSDSTVFSKPQGDYESLFVYVPSDWPAFGNPVVPEGDDGANSMPSIPRQITLSAAYPNPFNAATRVDVILPARNLARVDLIDMLGRRVRTVVDGPLQAGRTPLTIDAGELPSGMYLLLAVDEARHQATRKLVLVK